MLVVEDDALNRRLTKRLLGVLGYTSKGAETGEDALEFVRAGVFDLALAKHDLAEGLRNTSPYFLSTPFSKLELLTMVKPTKPKHHQAFLCLHIP